MSEYNGVSMPWRKLVVGKTFNKWLLVALLSWVFTIAGAYATYASDPEYARAMPFSAFFWLIFPGFIAAGVTWAVWSDYSWLRASRRLLGKINEVEEGRVSFSEPVKASPGLLTVSSIRTTGVFGEKASPVLLYESNFTPSGPEKEDSTHTIPKELFAYTSIIGNRSQGYSLALPALKTEFEGVTIYLAVIDPNIPATSAEYREAMQGVNVEAWTNGYMVKAKADPTPEAEPGSRYNVKLKCSDGEVEGVLDLFKNQVIPARTTRTLVEAPTILVIPEGMQEPPLILGRLGLKDIIALGSPLDSCVIEINKR